jgi:hypothetical protein
MGVGRTLKRLWAVLRSAGVEISLKRLEEYSAPPPRGHGWQARILERAARHESQEFVEVQAQVDRMNIEHVQMFGDLKLLLAAGIQKHKTKLEEQVKAGLPAVLDMDFSDMVRMSEAIQRGERLARGLATSKAEVIVEVLSPLVKDIFAVFLAANNITNDPPELVRKRQSEFIMSADKVLATYYTPAGKLAAVIKGDKP